MKVKPLAAKGLTSHESTRLLFHNCVQKGLNILDYHRHPMLSVKFEQKHFASDGYISRLYLGLSL